MAKVAVSNPFDLLANEEEEEDAVGIPDKTRKDQVKATSTDSSLKSGSTDSSLKSGSSDSSLKVVPILSWADASADTQPTPLSFVDSKQKQISKPAPCCFYCPKPCERRGPLKFWPYCSTCYASKRGPKCVTDGCVEQTQLQNKMPGSFHTKCEHCRTTRES
jgi:hypothetical protein